MSFITLAFATVLTSMAINAEKDTSVSIGQSVNMVLVRTLQGQLKTCMDQNADLVKRSCSAKGGGNGLPEPENKKDVAFHTGLTKPVDNLPHNYKVIFDYVYLNEGKGYDPHTGVFTCPIDGIYSFHWTILTTVKKYFYTDFMVNGKVVGRSYPKAGTVNTAASSTVVQKMKKRDKAWIEPHGSNTGQFAYGGWCFFSGFKI